MIQGQASAQAEHSTPKEEPLVVGRDVGTWMDNPRVVNGRIITLNLFSPLLDRQVVVYVYLPLDYNESSYRRYPVLYLHDGIDLFSGNRGRPLKYQIDDPMGWDIDITLDQIFKKNAGKAFLVVAIDSINRVENFSPWEWNPSHFAEGRQYMDFIVHTLKPHIDKTFRTFPDRENTAMMGSSFGGVISLYGGIKYPRIFSKIGMLSPVLIDAILGDVLKNYIMIRGSIEDMRIYMDMGSIEGNEMIESTQKVKHALLASGFSEHEVEFVLVPGGSHRHSSWKQRFPQALEWLFQ